MDEMKDILSEQKKRRFFELGALVLVLVLYTVFSRPAPLRVSFDSGVLLMDGPGEDVWFQTDELHDVSLVTREALPGGKRINGTETEEIWAGQYETDDGDTYYVYAYCAEEGLIGAITDAGVFYFNTGDADSTSRLMEQLQAALSDCQ